MNDSNPSKQKISNGTLPQRYTKDFSSIIRLVSFNSVGFFFLDFMIPYFASQQLIASGLEIGLIFSVQVVGFLLSSTFTGFITDRIKSKKSLVILGSFGRGTAYFLIYIAILFESLIGLGTGTFTLGFFAGFFWIPFDSLISQKSHKNNRSNAFGRVNSAMGRGMLLGSILGFSIFGFTINEIPESSFIIYISILIYGISNYYAAIQYYRKIDENLIIISKESSENNVPEEISDDIKPKLIVSKLLIIGMSFFFITILLSSINGSLAKPFLNIYIIEVIESDPSIAVLAYIPSGIVAMLLSAKIGKLVDKLHPALGISTMSIIGALVTFLLINSYNIWIFAILLIFDTLIVTTAGLILQNLLSRISLSHRGKIFGLNRFFSNLGFLVGPILGGLAWDNLGFAAPFMISIIVELLLIPFYWVAFYLIKPHLSESYEQDIEIIADVI